MKQINWSLTFAVFLLAALLTFMYSTRFAYSRDNGQWENSDPEIRKWFKTLMRPDHPDMPCCGGAYGHWVYCFVQGSGI